jgi:hypothetical protein
MQKRAFIGLLVLLTVAIVMLFAYTEAIAFNDEPCYGLNYEYCNPPAMSATSGGWTITLTEPSLRGDGKYDWQYKFTTPGVNFTGSNFVAFLIPDCCKDSDKIVFYPELSAPTNLFSFAVGMGEPTLNFGRYNQQAYVIKGTPDSTGNWRIVTNTKYKTRSTIIIKSGKDVATFEMAIPGCPLAPSPAPIGARTFSECANFGQDTPDIPNDDVSFYIVRRSDQEGCISSIWACTGNYCPNCANEVCTNSELCEQIEPEGQDIHTILQGSLIRSCPDENVSVITGSPFYLYTWNSGGTTYKKCLDLATGKYTTMCCCKGTCSCP